MSYEFYKILHLIGIVSLFSGLVGLLTIKMSGGNLEGKAKSLVFSAHGVGLLLIIVSGFGLLARLGLARDIPGWVFGKLAIWLILGGATAVIKKKGHIGWLLFIILILIFTAAAYLAILKPF
jgi:hypothetical protein